MQIANSSRAPQAKPRNRLCAVRPPGNLQFSICNLQFAIQIEIMRLAHVVSNQSRAIVVIVALLCVAGLYAAWQLPIAVFPQTDFPRIVIIVDNGEAPASQTHVSVTRPIEEAMNGIPGIALIKTKTARGSSE